MGGGSDEEIGKLNLCIGFGEKKFKNSPKEQIGLYFKINIIATNVK